MSRDSRGLRPKLVKENRRIPADSDKLSIPSFNRSQSSCPSKSTSPNGSKEILLTIIDSIASDVDDGHLSDASAILSSTEEYIGSRKQSIGERRLQKITIQMKDICKNFLEFNGLLKDNPQRDFWPSEQERKEYGKKLWYNLRSFFNGINVKDETDLENEQRSIDRQRKELLDQFYVKFSETDFEQFGTHPKTPIQRHHLCESHFEHCEAVKNHILDLFAGWDAILELFPSHSALELFDKRFDPRTKEGLIFYQKLFVIQTWMNLYSEINRLISILGRLMSCSNCPIWPVAHSSSSTRSSDVLSRPATPSSTSSSEHREVFLEVPRRSLSFISTPETKHRHFHHMVSVSNVDSLYQNSLHDDASSIKNYYKRYVDDQVTHARIELVARIFRSKHGPLLQRLRYIYRKEQRSIPSTFDGINFASSNFVSNDYLQDSKPDKLIDEFFSLSKKLKTLKNSDQANNTNPKTKKNEYGKANNILNRFDKNPTLTSSTFPSVAAPNLVSKIISNDRSVLRRQAYHLDYLDPTSYPHLPGSTLFPDPCTFLDQAPFDGQTQTSIDEQIIVGKILSVCHRLYEKDVWLDSSRFSDMSSIFHLPSLYPQYVFLAQIPFDLTLTWQNYHEEKKMKHTSNKSALLLLIDECKILIHSSMLVRQYVKLMISDTFEKAELKLIESDLIKLDENIIRNFNEILGYIERFVDLALGSNFFHECIILLRDQWKTLKKYSAIMNVEETLGSKFLRMCSKIINHYRQYIDVFHSNNETIRVEQIKKKIHRKHQKHLIMDVLREIKVIYDDCALTMPVFAQDIAQKRFLLMLKTVGFCRIQFENENEEEKVKENSSASSCWIFAAKEFFSNQNSRVELARTLSASYRIHSSTNVSNEPSDDSNFLSNSQIQMTQNATNESLAPSSVYVVCVPINKEMKVEWRGKVEVLPVHKHLTPISPVSTSWKTTKIFLLSQQPQFLDKFEQSFKNQLSEIHIQQDDYSFQSANVQSLQKRSCFERVDNAMRELADEIMNLVGCLVKNIEKFERLTNEDNIVSYVHTQERMFAFAMDIIRETSFYATQFDRNTFSNHASLQITFANLWLNFVREKKSTMVQNHSTAIPMCLLPGIHFLRHVCSLNFTNQVDNDLFQKFYLNYKKTMKILKRPLELNSVSVYPRRIKSRSSSTNQSSEPTESKKKRKLTLIEKIDRMDRRIDLRRYKSGLIGRIKACSKISLIPKKMEEDLLPWKVRVYHPMEVLARGQFAVTYKCKATISGKQEIVCYKQYKIQHNDTRAIGKILEQLIPLLHINHENLIRYHGLAVEGDHILFFMEYCNYGTIDQLLSNAISTSNSVDETCSPNNEISWIEKSIVNSANGSAFFSEILVKYYARQLLSALSRLHNEKIIHRDICNMNIFFTDLSKQTIKLGDVDFVYDYKSIDRPSFPSYLEGLFSNRQTIVFYAPETINRNETTIKSDIWSFGCTLLHMLTGKFPWSNQSLASSMRYYIQAIGVLIEGVPRFILSEIQLSSQCMDFLKLCFQSDPSKRPTSEDLLQHQFLTNEQ